MQNNNNNSNNNKAFTNVTVVFLSLNQLIVCIYRLYRGIVENKLAACVNIIPAIKSV